MTTKKKSEVAASDAEKAETKLVSMKHLDTGKLADVHPDEVDNYKKGGYAVK